MAEHTPGPWLAQRDPRCVSTFPHVVTEADEDVSICLMARFGQQSMAEHHANACLIAAAPELLAACEKLLAMGIANPEIRKQVVSAIAKATTEKGVIS